MSWANVTSKATQNRAARPPDNNRYSSRPGHTGNAAFGGRDSHDKWSDSFWPDDRQFSKLSNQGERQKDVETRFASQDDLWSGKSSGSQNGSREQQGKWKSRRVEETKKQEREKKRRSWWYLDPQQEVQGPFSEEEMKDWFNEGFFGVDLPVRCHPDSLFSKLGDWFAQGNSAFLESIPEEHAKKESPPVDSNPDLNQSPRKNTTMTEQQASFARHQFPNGSTLNGNAPIFNPMETRYQQQPNTLNAKPQNPPHTAQSANIFSSRSEYNNQGPAHPKKGYTTQHDLRQNNPPTTFDNAHNISLPAGPTHTRPPMVSNVGRFDGPLGPITTQPKHAFGGYTQPNNPDNSRVANSQHISMNRFQHNQQFFDPPTLLQGKSKDATLPPNSSNVAMIDLLGDSGKDAQKMDSSGGWKEIGIPGPQHGRQETNLSSPFGSTSIGADPYHINLSKHDSKSNSPWNRTIISTEVKKSQSDASELSEPERRSNDHSQIQRNRSPPEQNRNFGAWGMNGNNHRQTQNTRTNDGVGGKPRATSSWASSNSSWDTRPPRIPQVRNSQSPANQSRGSPSSQSRTQWRDTGVKMDDSMDKTKRETGGTTVLGSKNSSARSNNARKTLITKGDPTLNGNSKRSTANSTKSKKQNFSESNPFGIKISQDFEEWCLKQISEMTLVTGEDLDGRSLIHFLMTLSSKDEIRDYIVNYLGDSSKVKEFADGFIRLKKFEGSSGSDSGFQSSQSKRNRRKRRRKKGNAS